MYGNIFVDVQKTDTKIVDSTQPIVFDDELVLEEYVSGLMVPVNMEFIDRLDILKITNYWRRLY